MAQSFPILKRFDNEVLDVREFIRPETYMVQQLIHNNGWDQLNNKTFIERAWAHTVKEIDYPEFEREDFLDVDFHALSAFTKKTGNPDTVEPRLEYTTFEFWSYPSEVLRDKIGDCDDTSILLTSILRNRLSEDQVFMTVGFFEDFGHTWVTIFNQNEPIVLETTSNNVIETRRMNVSEESPYKAVFRFNDQKVVEVQKNQSFILNTFRKFDEFKKLKRLSALFSRE